MSTINKKILIINVPNISLFCKKDYLELSVGASFLAGGLEELGYSVDYYDLNIELNRSEYFFNEWKDFLLDENKVLDFLNKNISDEKIEILINILTSSLFEKSDILKFDAIAISIDRRMNKRLVSLASYNFSLLLSFVLKQKINIPVYIGGQHALLMVGYEYINEKTRKIKNKIVDGYFWGTGIVNFDQFLKSKKTDNALQINCRMTKTSESGIDFNIYQNIVKEKETNKEKELEKDISFLPKYKIKNNKNLFFDIRSVLPGGVVDDFSELKNIKPFYIAPYKFSLGCPYKCSFCRSGQSDYFYNISASRVVDNIEKIIEKYNVRNFRFFNNQINFNKKFVLDFCSDIIRRGLNISFSDSINLNSASSDMLAALKEAGCVKLWFGAETISPDLLRVNNKNLNLEIISNGFKNASRAGIWVGANIIVNFPHETEKDFLMLKEFFYENKKNIDCVECNNFQLLQGTKYYDSPDIFNIKISKKNMEGKDYCYDELGGLRWKEKNRLGEARKKEIFDLFGGDVNTLACNDYFLFALFQVCADKNNIKKIIFETTKKDRSFASRLNQLSLK